MSLLWIPKMESSLREMLSEYDQDIKDHTKKTPARVVDAYRDLFWGCTQDPKEVLHQAIFASDVDQMVTTKDIKIYSMCAHHLMPFFGYATFSYIPNGSIVGLSKVPRFINILSRRPQVQEQLTQQIVDTFMASISCKGCAVMIRAYHLCALMRGVEEHETYTETTALAGLLKAGTAKQEFLLAAQSTKLWGR